MKRLLPYLVVFLIGYGLTKLASILPVEAQTEKPIVGRYQLFQGEYENLIMGVELKKETVRALLRIDTVTGEVDELVATILPSKGGLKEGITQSCKWVPLEKDTKVPLK